MDVNAIESAWGSGIKRSSRGSAFVAKLRTAYQPLAPVSVTWRTAVSHRCGEFSQPSTAAAASCSELNRLHTDEGRQLTSASMRIETTEQLDVAPLIEVPVVLELSRVLGGDEHEIGKKPCGAAISVGERVYPYSFGVRREAKLAGCPVVRVLPPISDVVECAAEFDGDLSWVNPNVDVSLSLPPCPAPDIAIEAFVKIADEVIGQQFVQRQ
jgi:hypothetical protein